MQSANTEVLTPPVSNSRWAALKPWVVCLAATLFFFYEFIQMNMLNTIHQDLLRDFSLNAKQLGQLSAVYFFTNMVFLIPAGILLDRYSTKKLILANMLLCVIGTALFASAHSYSALFFSHFLTGMGAAFVLLSSIRIASRWFPAQRMALISGLNIAIAMLGGITAQTPLAMLIDHMGWRHALMVDTGLGFIILLIIASVVQDYPDGAQGKKTQQTAKRMNLWRSLKRSYWRSQNWLAAAYASLMNISLALLGAAWGSVYLIQVNHLNHTQASQVISMIFLGTIVGGPVIGWISDTIQRRRQPMLLGAVLSLATIGFIISNPHLSLPTLTVAFFILGLVTSTQVLSYPTVTESNPSKLTATAVSAISIAIMGGGGVLQPLFGALLQRGWDSSMQHGIPIYGVDNYQQAILIIPIGMVLAFITAFFIKETFCQRVDDKNDNNTDSNHPAE